MRQPLENDNTYFIDTGRYTPSSATELVRLQTQDRLTTAYMDLLPDRFEVGKDTTILDLACGPGGWALEVLERFPQAYVLGVDINEEMIKYACAQTQAQQQAQAQFRVMNILDAFPLGSASFDLINARFISGLMPISKWSSFLDECLRVTKVGGMIRVTEAVVSSKSSTPALQQMERLIARALWQAQMTFSEENMSICPLLGLLFQEHGYRQIQEKAYVINYSYGTVMHEPVVKNFEIACELLKPFLLKYTPIHLEELELLLEQQSTEMRSPNFRALWYLTSVIGQKF